MAHYTITPLEKKSIAITYEMYRSNPGGSVSWFNINDHYRWGRGFWSEEDECNLGNCSGQVAHCRADGGDWEGCEFDDSVACYFEFSDDIAEEEQELIKQCYYHGDEDGRGGVGWLTEGDHEWEEEDTYVEVIAPYKIEYCDEDGEVIREVTLRTHEEYERLRAELGPDWYIPNDAAIEPYKWKDE